MKQKRENAEIKILSTKTTAVIQLMSPRDEAGPDGGEWMESRQGRFG